MIDPAKKVHGQIYSILGDKSEVVGIQGRDIVDIGSGVRAIVSPLVGDVSPSICQVWGLMVGTDQERLDWSRSSGSLVENQERMYVFSYHSIRLSH